jgi:hypothetical protein
MPELREVFEMTTKQIEPDVDSWHEQEKRQRKANRNKRVGAFAVAAAIGLVAVVVILGTRGGQSTTTPASEPATANPVDATAEEVATGFLEAYGAFDVEQATTYLADDANLDLFGDDWRLGNRWAEATGFKVLLDSCAAVNSTTAGTQVRCPFDYHGIRSDEIGLGPYSGNYFELTVLEGKIVWASMQLEFMSNGFSAQMWEPFAKWVGEAYPEDAAVMYADWPSQSMQRMTEESIRLWERHTRGYVEEMLASP